MEELALSHSISELPCIVSNRVAGAASPMLVLDSEIFLSACQVDREQHGRRAKKQSGLDRYATKIITLNKKIVRFGSH